jgi:RND family efflux transporter MFP subunit
MTTREALLALLVLLTVACREEGPTGERPVAVRVRVAENAPISRTVVAPCILEGTEEAVLTVPGPVQVEEVYVSPGDSVRSGQPLVGLQTDQALRARAAAAAAGVSAARTAARRAADDLQRVETLVEAGAASRDRLESALAAVESAEAGLRSATAEYRRALSGMDEGLVRAPFEGVVTRVAAREGNPASGSLVALTGGRALEAELLLAQRWLVGLRPGLPVFFRTPHFPGRTFEGRVVAVSPAVDPVSGLVPARVQLSDTTGSLFAGLDGTATIAVRTEDSLPVLPQMALQRRPGGGWRAAVLEDGRARFREVRTGIRHGFTMQVSGGIREGDSVIVLGHNRLRDGDRARVVGR